MPRRNKELARIETVAWQTTNHDRKILVQRAYIRRTTIERKIARKFGIRIGEARRLIASGKISRTRARRIIAGRSHREGLGLRKPGS